ncbi:MAG: hypothetical protein J6U08_05355 [Paludibacteraceae bacterium]|nr:hypothetical protein [Paludibacteraceae bacterium]
MDRVGNGFGKAMVRLWHHTATAKDSQPIRREPLKKGANTGLWRLHRERHRCDAKVMGRGAYLYGRKGFAVMVRNVRVIDRRPTAYKAVSGQAKSRISGENRDGMG